MLRRLLRVDPAEFASSYWGRRPLHSPGVDRDAFADLFSRAAADELLSTRGLRTPFLRVAKGGEVVGAARFTRSGGAGAGVADQVADDRVLALVDDGHTVVLQGLHRVWPPLVDLATALAAELGHPVQVNAYVTPPESRGFAAHYDVHDVLVLQVAGRKRWCVHEPVLADPLPTQPWSDRADDVRARAAEEPALDLTMSPGDVLYLPRGHLHSAEARGEPTIHLTVGVHPATRHDVVAALVDLAAGDPTLRRSLPLGATSPPDLAADVLAVAAALTGHLDRLRPEAVAREVLARTARRTRPAPVGPLAQAEALRGLDVRTSVRLRRGLRYVVRPGPVDVELVLPDRSLRLPTDTLAALDRLLDGAATTPADLPLPTGDDAVTLVRRLVREGVLEVLT